MALKQTQDKPGTTSKTSKNPGSGRRPVPEGQRGYGFPSKSSKGSTSSKREVPGYSKGDEFNTGRVDKRRASQSVTDVSANKVNKIGGR